MNKGTELPKEGEAGDTFEFIQECNENSSCWKNCTSRNGPCSYFYEYKAYYGWLWVG